jgi:hypothetical protein
VGVAGASARDYDAILEIRSTTADALRGPGDWPDLPGQIPRRRVQLVKSPSRA